MLKIDWILVADRSRASIFHALPDGKRPFPVLMCFEHAEGRLHPQDLGSDKSGRVQLPGGARAVVEPHEDRRHVEARGFAHQIAEYLELAHHERRFDRLFVVAPPEFLGVLRETWSNVLRHAIVHEEHADLTQLPEQELQDRLGKLVKAGASGVSA